jgi:hypothetical protein
VMPKRCNIFGEWEATIWCGNVVTLITGVNDDAAVGLRLREDFTADDVLLSDSLWLHCLGD